MNVPAKRLAVCLVNKVLDRLQLKNIIVLSARMGKSAKKTADCR